MIIGYQVQDQHGNNWADRPSYEVLTQETAVEELKLARDRCNDDNFNMVVILEGDIEEPTFEVSHDNTSPNDYLERIQNSDPADLLEVVLEDPVILSSNFILSVLRKRIRQEDTSDKNMLIIEKSREVNAVADEAIHYEVSKSDWEAAMKEYENEETALSELQNNLKATRTYYEASIGEINAEFEVKVSVI